jgi:hypothetical protein
MAQRDFFFWILCPKFGKQGLNLIRSIVRTEIYHGAGDVGKLVDYEPSQTQ